MVSTFFEHKKKKNNGIYPTRWTPLSKKIRLFIGDESCRILYKSVMSHDGIFFHIWMSHWHVIYTHKSCLSIGPFPIWMSHILHTTTSWYTHKRAMSYTLQSNPGHGALSHVWMSHVIDTNKSYHSHKRVINEWWHTHKRERERERERE